MEGHPLISKLGDPILRTPCIPVSNVDDPELRGMIAKMQTILEQSGGVGLAAPQIGAIRQVLIYRMPQAEDFQILINPSLEPMGDEQQPAIEGCLSIPGIQLPVLRYTHVRVRATNLLGEHYQFDAYDLEARILQHEIDHLNGVLILDRVSPDLRREAMLSLNQL